MKWIVCAVLFPVFAFAETAHVKFLIKHFEFICHAERDFPLDEKIVLCDKTKDGRHVRVTAQLHPERENIYMVKGWVEEIGADGQVDLVSAPHVLAVADEVSQVSTTTNRAVDLDFQITVTPRK